MRPHGPWTILERQTVYRDAWLELTRDEVIRPDLHAGSHTIVAIKPGVTVIAIDEQGIAHLTEEFHYAVGRVTLEAVSGGIDAGESAREAAERELAEELGLIAADWIDLGVCDPLTAMLISPTQLYLARSLSIQTAKLEGTETLRHVRMPFSRAVADVIQSRITHAPSCLAILKAQHYLSNA